MAIFSDQARSVDHPPEKEKIVRQFPLRPDPDHLAREAKSLLRAAKNGDSDAMRRMAVVGNDRNLATAQLAIAREYGFRSWPKLKAEAARQHDETHPLGDQAHSYLRATGRNGEDHVMEMFYLGFDDELMTDREIETHVGACPGCRARYAFETNIVRGFADHIEAKCPKCGASLGEFREDWFATISVRLVGEGQ